MDLWKSILRQNFTDVKKLQKFLELPEEFFEEILYAPSFRLNLPLRLAKKIEKNSVNDPLFLQFFPIKSRGSKNFFKEPLQEGSVQKKPKLLHKYQGRALLLVSSACAMHCRYCFRQNFPYEKKSSGYEKELEYIRQDPSIHEVILSGGDPLSLDDQKLSSLLDAIDTIDHVKMVRFHTKFPIGIPERITPSFLQILRKSQKQIVFVIHINHVKEWDQDIQESLKKIASLGIPLLSQTVLLKRVNDKPPVLYKLFSTLSQNGVLPYYLHFLDPVLGAEDFYVSKKEGENLIHFLRSCMPGYAVPRFVQEIPGEKEKTLIV